MWFCRIWFVLALMLPSICRSGPLDREAYPPGLAGVRWSSTPEAVKQKILARGGITFVAQSEEAVRFSGGTFAEEPVLSWEFRLRRGFFSRGTVRLVPNAPLNQYRAICQSIADKYGKKGNSYRFVEDQPYERTVWTFKGALSGSYKVFCDYTERGTEVTYEETSKIELETPGLTSQGL